jgi:copper(I)-binding protein
MNRKILASVALGIACLGLSSCGGAPDEEAPAGPVEMAGIEVSNARLILPAVAGNPGAVYFDLTYNGERNTQLRSVSVEGAESTILHEMIEWDRRTEMAEMVPPVLKPGETLSFAPGGKHVMAMNLAEGLEAGGTTQVTISFAGGNNFSFDAEIREPGDDR